MSDKWLLRRAGALFCRAKGNGACIGRDAPRAMTAFSDSGHTVFTSHDRVLHAAVAAYLGRYRGQSRLHTGSDLRSSWPGAPARAWTRCAWAGWTSNGMCAGCRKFAVTSLRRSPDGCRWWSASTGCVSSIRSCRTRRPTTSGGHRYRPSHPRWDSATFSCLRRPTMPSRVRRAKCTGPT
jgi:hypothetical protein